MMWRSARAPPPHDKTILRACRFTAEALLRATLAFAAVSCRRAALAPSTIVHLSAISPTRFSASCLWYAAEMSAAFVYSACGRVCLNIALFGKPSAGKRV